MRNLDPVLIERANQVSFSGGGGNLVNREYLNALSRFSARFPVTDDLEDDQKEYLQTRLEGWEDLVFKAYSDRLRRRAEFVSWMVAGRSNYNFKKAQKQLDAERRAEESSAAKMAAYLDRTAKHLARLVSPARQIEAYASGSDATYLPTSMDVIVCRVVPTARASSSCDMRLSRLSSRMRVFMRRTSHIFAKFALRI